MATVLQDRGPQAAPDGMAPVDVKDLVKTYKTPAADVHALRGVSWQVKAGEAVALMGPSGCGKTTLLNVIAGMDHATSGTVRIGSTEVTTLKERELENYRLRKVGYIFQFFNLIPSLSALENLDLPQLLAGVDKKVRIERSMDLLGQVGLQDKAHKRPEELSGGEQQRVAVCLALVNDPPLIVGDEPTGNLDSKNRDVVIDLLLKLAKNNNKAVIVATHDPKVADEFLRVHTMRDGLFE